MVLRKECTAYAVQKWTRDGSELILLLLSLCQQEQFVCPHWLHMLTVVASVPAAREREIHTYTHTEYRFSPGSHLLWFSGRSHSLSHPSLGSRAGVVELQWLLHWPWAVGTAAPAAVLLTPFVPALPSSLPPFLPSDRMRHPEQEVQQNSRCFLQSPPPVVDKVKWQAGPRAIDLKALPRKGCTVYCFCCLIPLLMHYGGTSKTFRAHGG